MTVWKTHDSRHHTKELLIRLNRFDRPVDDNGEAQGLIFTARNGTAVEGFILLFGSVTVIISGLEMSPRRPQVVYMPEMIRDNIFRSPVGR